MGSFSQSALFAGERLSRKRRHWVGKNEQLAIFERAFSGHRLPVFTGAFWPALQRQGHSLHEVPFRACFKPQLPAFFLTRLTAPGDIVYDPYMGRGTTPVEAALHGRVPWACDLNPLGAILTRPRLEPPTQEAVEARLRQIPWARAVETWDELLVFYHPTTLRALANLRLHLLEESLDAVDRWIRLVALTRLTGHSAGYFSVYTLPPNQAVSLKAQARINRQRQQTPPLRDVPAILAKKSRALLRKVDEATRTQLTSAMRGARLYTGDSRTLEKLAADQVALTVTSPPFLDTINYREDNWLRLWFCGRDDTIVAQASTPSQTTWEERLRAVLTETVRLTRPGGFLVCEVGEVRKGAVRLEEAVIPCGEAAGFEPLAVFINAQRFTKTSNCWGIENGKRGTNSNRMVLFRKP